MDEARLDDVRKFYALLAVLELKIRGARKLNDCSGRLTWPQRGVYFFVEHGENRSDSGSGPRVVRIGAHALKSGSKTTLWTRLSQHKGQSKTGGGNHRGSIFRLIVGTSLIARNGHTSQSWGEGNNASSEIRATELGLEQDVSNVIGAMPVLWLGIDDEPDANSLRGDIERNAIALLSNFSRPPIDLASETWLGYACDRERVRKSGLWNSNHVDDHYDPTFLGRMENLIAEMESPV